MLQAEEREIGNNYLSMFEKEKKNSWHVSFDIDSKTHLYLSNIKMWENMQYGKNVMIWRRCSSYIFKF